MLQLVTAELVKAGQYNSMTPESDMLSIELKMDDAQFTLEISETAIRELFAAAPGVNDDEKKFEIEWDTEDLGSAFDNEGSEIYPFPIEKLKRISIDNGDPNRDCRGLLIYMDGWA